MNTPHSMTSEQRIDDLIGRMAPEEKFAQLHGIWLKDLLDDTGRISVRARKKHIPHGVGQVCQFASACTLEPDALARAVGDQEALVKRLIATGKPVVIVVFGGRPMVLTDLAAGNLALSPGAFSVLVGSSSTDIRMRSELSLADDTVSFLRRDHFFSRTIVDQNPPKYKSKQNHR